MCKNCPTCMRELVEQVRQARYGHRMEETGKITAPRPLQGSFLRQEINALIEVRRQQLFGYMRDRTGAIAEGASSAITLQAATPEKKCPECFCPLNGFSAL